MKYINTVTGEYPVSEREIRRIHNTSFPIPFVAPEPFAPVIPISMPLPADDLSETVEEKPPVFSDGQWVQVWEVCPRFKEYTDDQGELVTVQSQIEAESLRRFKEGVPRKISRRQGKQALLLAGLLEDVQPAIDAITDSTERALAQIFWDDSVEFERNNEFLNTLAESLGMSEHDIDNLFIQAIQL